MNKGVFNVGDIVEFDEKLSRRLIIQGVAIEYVEEKHSTEGYKDYNDLTIKELKVLLKEKGLSINGKKQELIERLKECDSND